MLIDGRSVAPGAEFSCAVCIVGAGPAGIAIADRLRGSGLSICLLESGGFDPELRTQRLYSGENVGHPYFRLDWCRFRLFGGSTNRWGGWCRPLDPFDYEKRDWVPHSGWPICESSVRPYYPDAARLLELPNAEFDVSWWNSRMSEAFPLEGTNFENALYQFSPQTNFGEVHGKKLFDAPNITTFVHSNVTELLVDDGTNRIGTVVVRAIGREPFSIKPRMVVLASGGIENPRLLLASRHDRPAGLGNEHDLVGRYFMEHLHVPAGHLVSNGVDSRTGFYARSYMPPGSVRGVIAPSPHAQAEHRLLACSVSVEGPQFSYGTPFLGWPPQVMVASVRLHRKLLRGRAAALGERARVEADRLYAAGRRRKTGRASRAALERCGNNDFGNAQIHSLYFRTEQEPNPASRVMLATEQDALGVPRIKLDWRVNTVDTDTVSGWLAQLTTAVHAGGLGEVLPAAEGWSENIMGGPHHLGTTRMSDGPKNGVVDQHCRVHSLDNLYVAGSSVFSTGGYANPTFTLVALALRLADRLHEQLI